MLSLSTAGPTLTTALFVQDMYPAGIYVLIAGALTSTGSLLSDLTLAVLGPRHPGPPSRSSSSRDDEEHAEEMPEAKD